MTIRRSAVLERLAGLIAAVDRPHPVRVAIDGPGAAGKTTLADELRAPLERRGRPVLRASVDGFHRPRSVRYQRGAGSPSGYYYDAFDYSAVCAELLAPLGPGGGRRYRAAAFDFRTDAPLDAPQQEAPPDAVLLFDGVFLLRPELNSLWDVRILVEVEPSEAMRRAVERDTELFGSAEAVIDRYRQRYIPAQQMYRDLVRPQELADVVVENSAPQQPRWSVRRRPG